MSISVNRAIWTGMAVVNWPVLLIMLVGLMLVMVFGTHLSGWMKFASLFMPVIAAWLLWSIMLPRWRVWALEQVEDREALINEAIGRRLMWPPGHLIEKTEIRSKALRKREERVGWPHAQKVA